MAYYSYHSTSFLTDESAMTPAIEFPISATGLLGRALTLYRRHFWDFVGLLAVPLFVAVVAMTALVLFPVGIPQPAQDFDVRALWRLFSWPRRLLLVLAFLAFPFSLALAQAATVFGVAGALLGDKPNIGRSYAKIRPAIARLAALSVLLSVGVNIGIGFFIVPGLLLLLASALSVPALTLEGIGPIAAIARSIKLLKGQAAAVLLGVFITLPLTILIGFLANWPLIFLQSRLSAPGEFLFSLLAASRALSFFWVGPALVLPWLFVVFTLAYLRSRVQLEGFDASSLVTSGA